VRVRGLVDPALDVKAGPGEDARGVERAQARGRVKFLSPWARSTSWTTLV
jgi:hypothetical protein